MILTVRAAVRGVIDFRQAKLRDVNWWRRTNLLISEMARQDEAAATHAGYLYHLALVANGELQPEAFKEEQKKARESLIEYISLLHPWSEKVRRQKKLDEVKSLRTKYLEVVGDPDDPLTVARWRRESAELEARTTTIDPTAATMAAVNAAIQKSSAKERLTVVPLD